MARDADVAGLPGLAVPLIHPTPRLSANSSVPAITGTRMLSLGIASTAIGPGNDFDRLSWYMRIRFSDHTAISPVLSADCTCRVGRGLDCARVELTERVSAGDPPVGLRSGERA